MLPLLVVTVLQLQQERRILRDGNLALMRARLDEVAHAVTALHADHDRAARRAAADRELARFCGAGPGGRAGLLAGILARLDAFRADDPDLLGLAVLDPSGAVLASTLRPAIGSRLGHREYFQRARAGEPVAPDLYLGEASAAGVAIIPYAAPVRAPSGQVVGVFALWLRASSVWEIMRAANDRAGPGSFYILFDRQRLRIGHSANERLLLRPAAPVPAAEVSAMVAGHRFQERTAELLGAVEPFPGEAFREGAVFRRFSPTNGAWNLGVSRRLPELGWTLAALVPERLVEVRPAAVLASLLPATLLGLALALLGGWLVMRSVVRPVNALATAAAALERGEFPPGGRVDVRGGSREVRELADAFQAMAATLASQRKLELELRQAQKLEAVGRLAAGIAHEMNTPIQYAGDNVRFLESAIRDLAALVDQARAALAREDVPRAVRDELERAAADLDLAYVAEQAPDAAAKALEGIGRVATIVRALREFAHPDRREMVAADLNRALLATLEVARNEYRDVADVETELAELPPVICHAGELNQVWLNLISNAARAIEEVVRGSGRRGTIRVGTRHEGGDVVVSVQDTGCGIAPEIREKVFEPFFTTRPVGRGMGQGLSVARHVVTRHGGSIEFQSAPGRGSTFTVRLPIQPPASGRGGAAGGGAPAPEDAQVA